MGGSSAKIAAILCFRKIVSSVVLAQSVWKSIFLPGFAACGRGKRRDTTLRCRRQYSNRCIASVPSILAIWFVPARRLEDRIRELCAKVLQARDAEVNSTLSELRSAMQEHTQRLRNLAASKLLHANGLNKERRSA
jgi:hypothetical protein